MKDIGVKGYVSGRIKIFGNKTSWLEILVLAPLGNLKNILMPSPIAMESK